MDSPKEERPTVIIGRKYQILDKIGSGSFGEVYRAMNLENGKSVAVKMENRNARNPQLSYEYKLMRMLKGRKGKARIKVPHVWWYGEAGIYNALVMELLGPSLENLFSACDRRFSLKTVLMLADQMIACVEYLHNNKFLHRDIKPENFVIGIGSNRVRLYLIDFGLAKKFIDTRSGSHVPYRDDKQLAGTVRYASTNCHLGIEQSRRDDLESMGYVLIYFLKGKLPWQGLQAPTKKEKHNRVKETKLATPVDSLCEGYPEFAQYINYCRGMRFAMDPDYMYLRRLFRVLFRTMNYQYDFIYDWINPTDNPQQLLEARRSFLMKSKG